MPEQATEEAVEQAIFPLLPFSYVVGQEKLRELLAIAYVMGSSVGGVLVSGERGTAKSTIVRSFAYMMHSDLPTTLPINATDDRVMGGWDIDALIQGNLDQKKGLLERANETKMLYIDEVNLLDDHIVNLILDVVSTGVLVVERDGIDELKKDISFMLVGTMNPEEGSLRPQMLDRFGLFFPVEEEKAVSTRGDILKTVLKFDVERGKRPSSWLDTGKRLDGQRRREIEVAKSRVSRVTVTDETIALCARVATEFDVVGHRAEIVTAKAAAAVAALESRGATRPSDVGKVAQYAIMHRRRNSAYADSFKWLPDDVDRLSGLIPEE
jgi:magnesium chelatase subunit I